MLNHDEHLEFTDPTMAWAPAYRARVTLLPVGTSDWSAKFTAFFWLIPILKVDK